MFTVNAKNEVTLTRGDNAEITVQLKDNAGQKYTMDGTDVLKFTMITDAKTPEVVLEKEVQGLDTIEFVPEDTEDLEIAKYIYDVQLTQGNGKVYTVIPPVRFTLTEGVKDLCQQSQEQ